MAMNFVVRELESIVEIEDIVLEGYSSYAQNREQVKHQFIGIVEYDINHITKDLDG